jgi:hypothetical protein
MIQVGLAIRICVKCNYLIYLIIVGGVLIEIQVHLGSEVVLGLFISFSF